MTDPTAAMPSMTPPAAEPSVPTSNGRNHADGSTAHAFERASSFQHLDERSSVIPLSLKKSGNGHPYFFSMPQVRRLSMVPSRIDRRPLHRLWRRICGRLPLRNRKKPSEPRFMENKQSPSAGWQLAARRRRGVLAILILLQSAVASWSLTKIFPYPWLNGLEIAILGLFVVLFAWISLGFWNGMMGFWVLWRDVKRCTVTDPPSDPDKEQPLSSRTAVLLPICNEDVERVFAGLEATYRSLAAAGEIDRFDFYILSDTSDPDRRIEEELAWVQTCRVLRGFGRIFYRHRRNNIKRKSGNISDFLRRWGRNYDYMIVFDADSVMAGETMIRLVKMMDRHPGAGIIQTIPTMINRESLFARVQQFAGRAYGPMLAAGLRFWQMGESYYWGHNAILRVAPFIKHCGLSRLPGGPPLGGEILSHDFVEAALMGRAGWEVWLAYDVTGSYEETPPTLLDELKRDRRWCQGNLQHLRLLFGDGIRAGHRAVFSMGVMAYASSLFWSLFLVLTTVQISAEALVPTAYFSSAPSLFPLWPQWRPEWAIALLSTTAVLLFLPKILALLLIVRKGEQRLFGGMIPLCASVLLEILASTLLAPIRMWFHGKFVLLTLIGRPIRWGSQCRNDSATGWKEAIRCHGLSALFAFAWITGLFWLNPARSWWLLPIAAALLLSIPLSVYSSRVALGRAVRRRRLFLTPEEVAPPEVVERLHAGLKRRQKNGRDGRGFVRAVVDPYVNAVHIGLLRGKGPKSAKGIGRNRNLCRKALREGPENLSRLEKAQLLQDTESMITLHLHSVCRMKELSPAFQATMAAGRA